MTIFLSSGKSLHDNKISAKLGLQHKIRVSYTYTVILFLTEL